MNNNFRSPTWLSKNQIYLLVYFFISLGIISNVMSPFFPNEHFAIGHDFSSLFPGWLDGKIWYSKNGVSIPWFTPSFCAGQPYFADPQSTFYSLPQWLNFFMTPLNVVFTMFVVSSSLVFWGYYFLMRSVFKTAMSTAGFVATIMMFNGFLPDRFLVGHLTFHGYALIPWIALLLMAPFTKWFNRIVASLIAGAMIAYWTHSGLGSLLFAGYLSVLTIFFVYGIRGGAIPPVLVGGLIASVFAGCLALSKILAASAFLSSFSRTFYTLPGGKSIIDTILMMGGGLFLPSQSAYFWGMPRITNLQWALDPHEWAYNFSAAILILGIGLMIFCTWQWKQRGWIRNHGPREVVLWNLLLLAMIWPLAFNYYSPGWNAVLKTIPVVNSTSTPLRWIIIYIPLIAIGVGLMLERVDTPRYKHGIIGIAVLATVGQFVVEPRSYYQSQGYDARPLSIADDFFNSGRFQPEITTLGTTAVLKAGAYQATLAGNDTMIAGVSQVFCYNPIFGYRLEKFSAAGLLEGSVLHVQDGHLNLKNPACYVFPKENGCQPGDLFRADQIEEATKFVHYQPFAFAMPTRQVIANDISFGAFCLLVLTLLVWALLALSRLIRKQ